LTYNYLIKSISLIMNRYSLLVIFVFSISKTLYSQSIDILDEKNGFREFKLGEPISNYPNFLKREDNKEFFVYMLEQYVLPKKDENYRDLGGSEIFQIGVNCFEDKIQEIVIIMRFFPGIISYFQKAFGVPNFMNCKCEYEKDALQLYSWNGKKTSLIIVSNNEHRIIRVKFYDRELSILKKEKEEFEKRKNEVEIRKKIIDDF
jgi:hypothetical protein